MTPEIEAFINEIQSLESEENTCFIVEGKRDEKALKNITNQPIITLTNNLYLVAENIAHQYEQAVILTDLDHEGRKLYSTLKHHLTRLGVRIIDKPRELLFKTTISHVEGLPRLLTRTRNNFHHV